MDWRALAVGVVGVFVGLSVAVILGALAAAGRADRRMGEQRGDGDAKRQHSTHTHTQTQNTHTDTHNT